MSKTKQLVLHFMIAAFGVFAIMFGIKLFNQYLLMKFCLESRMVLMMVVRWLLLLPPGLLILMEKSRFRDIGFIKENILRQILIGIILALLMSAVFTVLPILLGFRNLVGKRLFSVSSTLMRTNFQFVQLITLSSYKAGCLAFGKATLFFLHL